MVHHHDYHHHRLTKSSEFIKDEESHNLMLDCSCYKRIKSPKLLTFFFLITLLSGCYVLALVFLGPSFSPSLLYSPGIEIENNGNQDGVDVDASIRSSVSSDSPGTENDGNQDGVDVDASIRSSVSSGTISCDRSGYHSDICMMKGDIRTHSPSSSIFLYNSRISNNISRIIIEDKKSEEDQLILQHEKIKPYTRKWEKGIMETIDELNLISKKVNLYNNVVICDVQHDVPAVFFSTGGYTGNVYHDFNDGIIPLYFTSQHFNKKVVFVILQYHNWWIMKYGDILSHLSDFPPIDFRRDNRTHCFPEAIVGLRIHDDKGKKSIVDFRNLLDNAYRPRIKRLIRDEEKETQVKLREQRLQESTLNKPKLVIISRKGSRAITNEKFLVKMAVKIGFNVKVLRPGRTSELAEIYRTLNESDVMIGVHGAALTHLMFMRPSCVFIQVIPLGTNWAAETCYGETARKLGLKYIGYEILPRESSLYKKYSKDDPVLRDPKSITKKGWEYTKKYYLDNQNVVLDLRRFRKKLHGAYEYTVSKSKMNLQHLPK